MEGTINGILQPIADGFKLIFKETVLPSNSVNIIFILAPIMAFFLGLPADAFCLLEIIFYLILIMVFFLYLYFLFYMFIVLF